MDDIPDDQERTMDYKSIIKEIEAGLTGDPDKDIEYLQKKAAEYRESEYAQEIMRELGRMAFEALPESEKEKMREAMQRDTDSFGAVMDEAAELTGKGDYQGAIKLLSDLAEKMEPLGMVTEDKVSIYTTFNEPFEDVLYRFRNQPEKDVRPAAFPLSELYYRLGALLFEVGDYKGAEHALMSAVAWNPMSAKCNFEYFETLKATGRIAEFYDANKAFIENCFRPWSFARAYRNLAFCYVEMNEYRDAWICLDISSEYEDGSEALDGERKYILQKNGGEAYDISPSDKLMFCSTEELPRYPDVTIHELAVGLGDHYMDQGADDLAEYFHTIARDLFPDGVPGAAGADAH